MWMVAGAHRSTTDGRLDAHVAFAASFTKFDIAVIGVSNLPDGGIATLTDQANFSRGHTHLSVVTFLGTQLS
jgi:hypothetical protein